MEALFESYLDRLQKLHTDIEKTFEGLAQEALDWIPGAGMNSMAVIVTHLTGAERYWIGDLAGEDPSGRDRAAEFRVRGLDAADLKKRLNDSLEYARLVAGRLSLVELAEIHTSPRDGKQFSVAWSLLHALEHTAVHLGHLQIMRQLWDQQQGSGV
jgi:uncharacterized damage-inducible protein DinB